MGISLKKLDLWKIVPIVPIMLGIVLVFTLADFFVHSLSPEYAVPERYFRNKVMFGTLYGVLIFLLVRRQPLLARSIIFSFVLSALLQARYLLEGYPLNFVFLFLGVHFVILLPLSFVFFRIMEKGGLK